MDTGSGGLVALASQLTVGELLCARAALTPGATALADVEREWTYRQFNERVNRLAHALLAAGIAPGDRIAVLSENRLEYLELTFACAKLGAILCALNWRLTAQELRHCIRLATPRLVVVSQRHAPALHGVDHGVESVLVLGPEYESLLAGAEEAEPRACARPEDGLVILYTSGTTGLPKGALLSHRAEIARMALNCMDFALDGNSHFVAWPPLFHMASMDQAIAVLCLGGKVTVVDGFDVDRLVELVATEPIWWLILLPGAIDRFSAELENRRVVPRDVQLVGAMADLVPRHQIAELTTRMDAPYANTFGSTETGLPPASAGRIPVGVVPERLDKQQSSLCAVRLVDAEDREVPDGTPGELAIRGPTLFSGYWNAPQANAEDFRGGWFHLGDAFVRNSDGTLRFVDRVKYLIKSGGENIYPAEIESILLADARIEEAVVVRKPDPRWGEVPVAFVAARDAALTAEAVTALCERSLARYKRPRDIRFVGAEDFPRSTTGKVQRHEVERWLKE